MEQLWTFVISFLASLSAIWLLLFSSWVRRPRLSINIFKHSEYPIHIDDSERNCRWLHVEVDNSPQWPFKWVESASSCEAKIEFLDAQGGAGLQTLMTGRWVKTPEPINPIAQFLDGNTDTNGDKYNMITLYNQNLIQNEIEIRSGRPERLDVAFRIEGEDECYGWCNEGYRQNFKPPQWKLEKGRYIVKITIYWIRKGKKLEKSERFLLVNDMGFKEFRLAPAGEPN